MTTPTITDYLKYANLQMAAEAFLYDETTGKIKTGLQLIAALQTGNNYALRFTQTQAEAFAGQWKVVDQKANTPTGFSGTLFQSNSNSNEYVISFRSTEFIDDAIRDSAATNTLEIHDAGWALGQITDMEAWYASVKSKIPAGAQLNVTGYSLGGHLATTFNLLRREELAQGPQAVSVGQVITYNGAGVGSFKDGGTKGVRDILLSELSH